jgi:hypothetical protein
LRFYLPESTDWYNFYTSEVMDISGDIRYQRVEQEEIGVFVKAGSIIPRKYMRRLSALQTKDDNYLIDIYPQLRGERIGYASGFLYLDDGESYNYERKNEQTLIEFVFDNDNLTFRIHSNGYLSGESFIVDEVNVFGINRKPSNIRVLSNTFVKEDKIVQFKYSEEAKQIEIINLNLHLIDAPRLTNEMPLL